MTLSNLVANLSYPLETRSQCIFGPTGTMDCCSTQVSLLAMPRKSPIGLVLKIQILILEVFIVFCLYEYIKYILVTRCVSEWTKEYTYIHYIWMLELCIIYVIVSILVCLYEYVDGGLQSVVISTVFSSILHMTPHYHITIYRVDREFNICIHRWCKSISIPLLLEFSIYI